MKQFLLGLGLSLLVATTTGVSAEPVKLSLFSWPGYGFWFIAQEKGLT